MNIGQGQTKGRMTHTRGTDSGEATGGEVGECFAWDEGRRRKGRSVSRAPLQEGSRRDPHVLHPSHTAERNLLRAQAAAP